MKRRLISILCLLSFMVFSLTGSLSAAVSLSQTKMAPVNPDFINYFKTTHPTVTPEGYSLGLVPETIDSIKLGNVTSNAPTITSIFPATYDLRNINGKNFVTAVRDQYPSGTCWTFGACASLESSILKATNGTETKDFSENNIKNRLASTYSDGFDRGANTGGNTKESTAYMARWGGSYSSGPVLESQDPFVASSTTSSIYPPNKHVQEVLFLPDRTSETDNAYIPYVKSALMNYGGVAVGFDWDASHYASPKYAYYNPTTAGDGHVVTIIGWDDTFATSNFVASAKPAKAGAWICKNSWGTSFGNNGYFYMSFYDHSIKGTKVFPNPEPTNNYTTNYQYDPLGWTDSLGENSDTAWGANIFTGISGQSLKAVSFYTPVPSSSYEISIYTGVAAGKPTSGSKKINAQSGKINLAGYHTIKLNQAVLLDSGKFSVVVKFKTPNCTTPVPIENAIGNNSSHASASAGQSFYSANGTVWTDTTSIDSTSNVCIKAFSK